MNVPVRLVEELRKKYNYEYLGAEKIIYDTFISAKIKGEIKILIVSCSEDADYVDIFNSEDTVNKFLKFQRTWKKFKIEENFKKCDFDLDKVNDLLRFDYKFYSENKPTIKKYKSNWCTDMYIIEVKDIVMYTLDEASEAEEVEIFYGDIHIDEKDIEREMFKI